jgi:hypothetical protein
MTPAVAKYLEMLDAAIAAGGVLSDMARAMIDTITNGGSLQFNATGVTARWRTEARRELRRRVAGNAQQPTGNHSEDARSLHTALTSYAASGFDRDKRAGGPPAKNAALFEILTDTGGKVPAERTLRRRLRLA